MLNDKVAVFVIRATNLRTIDSNAPKLIWLNGSVGPLTDPIFDLMIDYADTLLVDKVAGLVTTALNVTLSWRDHKVAVMVVLAGHSRAENVVSGQLV